MNIKNLHIHLDPLWYLGKLYWIAIILGGLLILAKAAKNRRENRKDDE